MMFQIIEDLVVLGFDRILGIAVQAGIELVCPRKVIGVYLSDDQAPDQHLGSVIPVLVADFVRIPVQLGKFDGLLEVPGHFAIIVSTGTTYVLHLVSRPIPNADARLDAVSYPIVDMDVGDSSTAVPVVFAIREPISVGVRKGEGSAIPDVAGIIVDGPVGCADGSG